MVSRVLSFEDIDAALADDKEAQQTAATFSAVKAAEGMSADQYAQALKVSADTGVSPDVAMRNPDLTKKLNPDDLLAIFEEVPEAKPWVEKNAKLLDGDFSTLGRVKATMNVIGQKASNVGQAAKQGLFQFNRGFYGTFETAAAMAEQANFDKLAPFTQLAALSIAGREAHPYLTGLRKGQQANAERAEAKIKDAGYFERGVLSGVSSLIGQAPSMLLSVATGNPYPVLATAGITSGGNSAADALDAGKSPTQAAIYGASDAAIEVATERLPIAKLLGDTKVGSSFFKTLTHQVATEVPGELTATTLQNLNRWAVMNPDQPFSTYLKQLPSDLGQTLIATFTAVGANTGIAHGVGRAARWKLTPEEAQAHIDGLNQLARSEPLAQRSPQEFQSLMQSISPDEHLYIDGQTALDTVNAMAPEEQAQLFNAIPTLRDELENAASLGGDVKINKADYTAFIAPNPAADSLRDFIKLDPEDQSVGERAAMQKFLTENPEAAKLIQQQVNEVPLDATAEEMMPAIERIVRKSILDSGRGSVEARAVAPLFARTLARFSAPFGQNAVEQLNQRLLQFQSVDAQGNAIKTGSNLNVILNDLEALQSGKRVAGLDDIGRAAVESFGGRLANAGMTIAEARALDPMQLLDTLYPKQQAQTVQVGDTEISLPQVDVGFDGNGGLNIGIRQTPDDSGNQAERQYLEQRSQETMDKDGDGRPDITPVQGLPEGAPLNTNSPEFEDWFGDSKVVDEHGEPQVVYHGTENSFDSFDMGRAKSGQGFWFSTPRIANLFAGDNMAEGVEQDFAAGGNVMPVYLKIENPFVYDPATSGKKLTVDAIVEAAHAGGHDGVQMQNSRTGEKVWMAFQPNQIKSIFNRGTWSPETANILEQGERGSITMRGKGAEGMLRNVVIAFTEQANFSTAAHEFSHFAVATHRYFAGLAQEAIANGETNPEFQRIIDDWNALKEEVGATGDNFTVEQEELIADKFEAYLRTGQAPSEKLRRIFTRFRDWLTKIYKDIRVLGGEPSKKTAEVFDRWLASEAEIAKVQEKNSSIAQIAESLGLPPDIIDRISDYVASATANAEESLYRKLSGEERKRQSKAYKEEFDRVRKDVVEDLSERKEYNLMAYLKENGLKMLSGPETTGINPDIITDTEGENTVHPDDVAELYGYNTGLDMLRALRDTPDFDRAADRETRERLMDKYPDMIRSGRIVNEAVDAIYNDRTLLALDLMIKELGGNSGMKQFAKAMAQSQVEKMQLSESNYGFRFEIAREKALREALQLSRAGKPQDALLKLQQAMVNQLIYKRLQDFRELRDKAETLFAKVDDTDKSLAPTKDIDFIGAARFILRKYGLGGQDFDIQAWLDDVEQRNPDVMNDLIGLAQIVSAPQKSAKELTIAEFRDIYNAVENIFDTARKMKEFEKNGKKYRVDAIVGDLMEKMGEVTKPLHEGTSVTGKGKIRNTLSSMKAAMRRVELWSKAMDGNGDGPFSKFIYDTVKQAENSYHKARDEWLAGYVDILKAYKKDLNAKGKIPTNMMKQDSVGRQARLVWKNKMEMIGFLLHTGNESNLDKLLGGYGIDRNIFNDEIERLTQNGTITERDWQLVQKLWDYVESLKPIAQQAHKKLYGYRFDEIESQPFTVGDISMRGGYWPAVADGEQASNNKTVEQVIGETRQYMLATVGKGFTKNRVSGYRQPLKTDLRLGSNHIDKVLRFAHLEPAVRDVARIINRQEFKDKLKAIDYDAFDGMLTPWLGRVATQTTEPPVTPGDRSATMGRKILGFMKGSAIAQIMYYNVVVPIQNIANMSVALQLTSARSLARAWAKTSISPLRQINDMKQASPYMSGRLSTNAVKISNQLNHIAEQKGSYTKTKDYVKRNGFIFMLAVDSYLGTITWQAAYDDQYRKTGDDTDAIRHADSVVRQVMGAGGSSDISKVEASPPLMKAIMPFYGYFNSQMNLITTEFGNIMREHGWRGSPKMFASYISLIAAPAIIGDLIAKGLRGGLPGEDDDDDDDGTTLDDWLAFSLESQVKYLAAGVPLLSPVATALLSIAGVSDQNGANRTNISPVIGGYETVKRTAEKTKKMMDGDDVDDARYLRDVMTSLGLVTGIPLGQVAKPLSYAVAVEEGEAQPEDGVDVLRGVLTGPPRK